MAALIRICLSSALFPNSPSSFTRLTSSLIYFLMSICLLSLSVRANDCTRPLWGDENAYKMKAKPELQAIIGETEITREKAIEGIRRYIKENNLQIPNGYDSVCDEKLKKLFGKERIDMFKISSLLDPYLEK